jgi:hypothetical protein
MTLVEGVRAPSRETQYIALFVLMALVFAYYMYADEKPVPAQPLPPGTRPPVVPKDEPWPWENPNKQWPTTPR